MDAELKTLTPEPPTYIDRPEPLLDKDDRPLLKPDRTTPEPIKSDSPDPNHININSNEATIDELEKKYAAYVRRDVYGAMGRGVLPWTEKAILGLALVVLVPVRVVIALSMLMIYYIICKICTAAKAPYREDGDDQQEDYAHVGGWRRAVILMSGRYLSRILLFVLGFYWISETRRDSNDRNLSIGTSQFEALERPGAIISNHISYLDILYHMSTSFPSFVAKRSVGKLPLIGLISKCLGCVFVQREEKSSDFKGVSGVVNERIRESYQNKDAPVIMLFPEGTTTNGDYLLPFKTGAFLAKAPVLPVILKYPYQRFSPAWDTISGIRHVILLFCQFVNYLEVTRLPIYYPSQQEKDDPKLYAENVRRLMAREGNLGLSDIGLLEKRVYHAALNGNNSMPTVLHQKDA